MVLTIGAITIAFFIGTKVKARVIIFDSIGIIVSSRSSIMNGRMNGCVMNGSMMNRCFVNNWGLVVVNVARGYAV